MDNLDSIHFVSRKDGGKFDYIDPRSVFEISANDFEEAFNLMQSNFDVLVDTAIKSFITYEHPEKASYLTNFFTKICIKLDDRQISLLMDNFTESIRRMTPEITKKYNLTNHQAHILISGTRISESFVDGKIKKSINNPFNAYGVKAMVRFIRSRQLLYKAKPETPVHFYIEDYLDSVHKIDLLELVQTENGFVLNLIQLKSHRYGDGDTEKYHSYHRNFVNGFLVDIESYESALLSQPDNVENIDSFMSDNESVENAFLEFLTSGNFSKDDLLKSLGIDSKIKRAQKFWIIRKYLSLLKDKIRYMKEKELFEPEEIEKIEKVLSEIQSELNTILSKTRDLTGITEVYSVCASEKGEESKELIFSASGSKRKAVKLSGVQVS